MNLLELTLQGGVLIGAILLLRQLGRYRLPGWTFRILWGVALARLLIPVALPFPWNVYAGLEHLADVGQTAQTAPGVQTPEEVLGPSQGGVIPDVPALPVGPDLIPVPEAAPAAVEIPWLAILYLAGAAALALLFLVSYRRGVRVFRTALPLTHPAVNQWRGQIPALRGVPIRRCDRIRSPLTYGLIRPVVLLPKGLDCDDTRELGYVLLHEGAHIRHRDAWWKLLLAAALCVHWFNPLVWCMYVCANRDLERCCDESVVRACGLEARSEYALTLLKWEERRSGLLPLCSDLGTPILKERVIFIMKLKKRSAAALALAAILVLGTTAAFATGPLQEETTPQAPASQDVLPAATEDPSGNPDHTAEAEDKTMKPDTPGETASIPMEADGSEPSGEPVSSQEIEQVPRPSEADLPIPVEEALPGGDYPKNQRGETYGSVTYAKYAGHYPDLTAVEADNGKSGYVLSRDNDGTYHYPGTLDTEDEASVAAWKEWLKTQPSIQYIPVYDAERETVIGLWTLYNPLGYDIQQPLLDVKMAVVENTLQNELGWDSGEIESYIQSMREEYVSNGWDDEETKTYIQTMREKYLHE